MRVGASTSNLYPQLTEEALACLLELGIRDVEIFLNTVSEAAPAFCRQLRAQADAAGAHIRAVHPYSSGVEPYLLFSAYERRFRDGLEQYKGIFEAAQQLGAEFVVLHGDRENGVLSVEDSLARYEQLYDIGRACGVTLAQENVVRFRSSDLAYLRAMRQQLGDKARFVLDCKQSRRCGLTVAEVMDAMGNAIAHVHVSDAAAPHDCLLPGQGSANFPALLRRLRAIGFEGCLMLELYRGNFTAPSELREGCEFLDNLLDSARKDV